MTCPDCDKQIDRRSAHCIKHAKLGVKRPDMIGHKRGVGNKWNLGRALTDEIKQKISETKKGIPMSVENKAKIYAAVPRGADHPNWKGGTGTERHMAQERTEYKQWRSAVFARDNYTCQICDQYNGHLHADHIKTWAEYPELRYDVNNGRTLCRACHFYITFKRKLPATSRWGLTSQEK